MSTKENKEIENLREKSEVLTIRQIEATKFENKDKTAIQMQEWGIYKYPVNPKKKIKSVGLLKKKITEFFESVDLDADTEDLPTVSRLAVFLGYPSQTTLMRDIYNEKLDEQYRFLLDRAVDIIKDNLQRRQLRFAEQRKDWQGVDAVLQRIDKEQDKARPDTKKDNDINISISIDKQNRIDSIINEKLNSLVEDVSFDEVTEQEPLMIAEEIEDGGPSS